MILVPRLHTPIPLSTLRAILVSGHHTTTGTEPEFAAVTLAMAQLCHEHDVTSGELRAVSNNCLGNVDATAEQIASGPCFRTVPENEIIKGEKEKHVHTRPSFATPEEGAANYWRRLIEGWNRAYPVMGAGALAFAIELKVGTHGVFYTDSVSNYVKGLDRWLVFLNRQRLAEPPDEVA